MSTLKDVAKLAGVSVATASLALNGKPVSSDARVAVIECAKKLNYVPNEIGRMLSTGRSNTVQLLIINSKKSPNLVKEISFFYHMIEGILSYLELHEQSLHYDVRNWEDDGLNRYFEQKVRDKTIDGIIIIPQFIRNYEFLSVLQEYDFPYVILNSCFEHEKINTVKIDNYNGGRLAAELLLKAGYTRIGIINGPRDHYDAVQRKKGFLDTLGKENVSVDNKAYGNGDFTIESGYQGARMIFGHYRPEALFCANDYMAAGAMRFIYDKGLRIPKDVAVVGYDNLDIAQSVYPQLTTVDNRIFETGKQLAESVHQIIFGETKKIYCIMKPFLQNGKTVDT